MGRSTSRIRKAEVARLISAVGAAGLEPQGVKIDIDGSITAMTERVVVGDLDRELMAFEAKHAGSS